jgi:microcystin-dependent protein
MWGWLKALLAWLFGRGGRKPAAPMEAEAFSPGPAPPAGMQQLIVLNGSSPESGAGNAQFTIGMIQSFAGSYAAYGMEACQGSTLPIVQNQPLFAVIGTSFGGDGMNNLAVPDLHARVAIGGAQVGRGNQNVLVVTWLIAIQAGPDAPMPGAVVPFGGNDAPQGWALCSGQTLPIFQYPALYQAIGTAFGGNGETNFLLPNLAGTAPVGVGPGTSLGQKIPGTTAGLGLNYIINANGPLAPDGGNGQPPANGGYAGQVIAYAGSQIPQGWLACDGSVLQISAWPTLFQAIGSIWGGDGKSSFALPDLRGKMLLGS